MRNELSSEEEDHYLEDVEEEIIQHDPRLLEGGIENPKFLGLIDLHKIKKKYSGVKDISELSKFDPVVGQTKGGIETITIKSLDHRALRYYLNGANGSIEYAHARIIKRR